MYHEYLFYVHFHLPLLILFLVLLTETVFEFLHDKDHANETEYNPNAIALLAGGCYNEYANPLPTDFSDSSLPLLQFLFLLLLLLLPLLLLFTTTTTLYYC